MPKLKTHKTVEQIARKHRLDVSFIQKQLDMGEPIEHEHTKDHELAMDIALQHLDEIPDYYTRLKKMEASAKKEHKKFKDVKENLASSLSYDWDYPINPEGVRYCPKCKRNESREECSYGTKYWDLFSQPTKLKEDLSNWFDKEHPDGNWKRYNTKGEAIGPCAREPGEPKPKCLSNKKAAQLRSQGGANKIAAAVRRKRKEDPVANRSGKGEKPIMVSNKIKEEHEEERYCPLCDKRETRSECSYGGKAWDKVSVRDHEYSMVRSELQTLMSAAQRIQKKVGKGEGSLEAWVQSKITKAADYIDTAADYIDSGEMEEQKIVDKIKGEIVVEKCWTGYKRKKGTSEFEKGSCVKVENVTIEDADGNTFAEVIDLIKPDPIKGFKSQIEEENKPTNPALWSKAKSLAKQKFDVYPSAYANGWAAKWYKSKGGGWKSVSEEIEIDEATRLQAQTGNILAITLSWRGKYYAIRMFFPQTNLPTRQEVNNEIQKVYPGGRVVHHSVSEFTPGQPLIQAGPQGGSAAKPGANKNYVKPMGEEVEIDEDWQKVNRQDRTDGLSQAAVNAYRRENPGSKLQTAVTEKEPKGKRAKRRLAFCRRMKGMKERLTSAETARDPDSRINRALRRWNCN